MAAQIRVFVIDEETSKPRVNVLITISTEFQNSSSDRSSSFTLGIFQTDHAGYISIEIPDTKLMPQHLWVSLLANSSVRVDALPLRFSPLPAVVILKIPTGTDVLTRRLYPSLHIADSHDRKISPYSFTRTAELPFGQGNCEDLFPSSASERTFSFNQIMLDANSPATDLVRLSTNQPEQTLAFSQLRRGALIRYSIEWLPLGHSLGEILYSLPLAPCESVNLAVIDWKREDQASRQEGTQASETLTHNQRRDRSVEETVSTALREWQSGNTVSVGGTIGVGASGIAASVTAGASWSSSTGGRNLNGETLQSLADSISQASSLVRSLYSTVVVQSSQTERDSIQTRTVRNHNHCHALTILYYEVLRQYKILTKIAKIQDVILLKQRIFSPDENMSYKTLLAFRHLLEDRLLEPRLRGCFEAIVRREYEEISAPSDSAPSEPESSDIYRLWFYISIPTETELGHRPDTNKYSQTYCLIQRKDTIKPLFYSAGEGLPENGAPKVIEIDPMEPPSAGRWTGWLYEEIESWTESVRPLKVNDIVKVGIGSDIHATGDASDGDQWDFGRLRVEYSLVGSETSRQVLYDSKESSFGTPVYPLPYYFEKSGAVLRTGELIAIEGYAPSTPWWGPTLAEQNDAGTSPAMPDPGLSQRKADAICAKRLLDHVNANGAYYRSLILMNTHPDYYAVEFEKIAYRSGNLLEYADFHPIAVFGDYVVFAQNTPTDSNSSDSLTNDLLAFKVEPVETYISLPTRGILAEAKLSNCNACEEIDETRFWNWTESPCTDEAPSITGVTPGSRARDIDTRPAELPSPVVNIVNPPAAPDPTGLAAAMNVIGTPNIFRDMSGRQELSSLLQRLSDGTISLAQARQDAQRLQQQSANANAAASPRRASTENAREIIGQDQAVTQAIRRAQDNGSISPAEARTFTRQHIGNVLANESERAGTGTGSSTTYLDTDDWGTGPLLVPTIPPEHRRLGAFIFLYNFPVDGVELQSFHRQSLDGILDLLLRLESYNISLIEGHASDTGAADPERRETHNMELSRLRGESARRYLVDGGFPDELLSAVEALGDNAPIRVTPEDMNHMRRRGYRGTEDELNRSVVLRFEAIIRQPLTPQTRIDVPVPRYELPRHQHWEMLLTVEFAAGEGGGGAAIHIRIRPRGVPPGVQDREVTEFLYVGVGFFGELALPVEGGDLNDWDSFDTERPIPITDFYFQPAVITEPFTAGVIWQISLFNYFYLPLLMNDLRQAADLGGVAYGIGVSSSVHAGMLLPIGHATLLMP